MEPTKSRFVPRIAAGLYYEKVADLHEQVRDLEREVERRTPPQEQTAEAKLRTARRLITGALRDMA